MLDFARSQKPFTCASCTSHMVSRFTRVNVGQEFALQLSDTFFFLKCKNPQEVKASLITIFRLEMSGRIWSMQINCECARITLEY